MTVAREYLRVSKDKSGRGRSTEEQHDENLKIAESNGWTLGAPYVDTGSASRYAKKKRGDFDQLIDDLKNDRFNAQILILWESSRGSRRVSEWALFLELLEEKGVQVYVTSHGRQYSMSNGRDRRTLQEDGVDSEYESYKTHLRIVRDKESHAAKGKPAGRLLYGHIREYDPHTKRYLRTVLDVKKAAVIRWAALRVMAGHKIGSICNDLNTRGIPTPRGGKRWNHRTLVYLLTNPGYISKRIHQGEVVGDADWPRVLDDKTFYTVKRILLDPSRKTTRDLSIKHLQSGIARCGGEGCGEFVYVHLNHHIQTYSCTGPRHVSVAKAEMDDFVERVVIERLSRKDFQDALRRAANGETDDSEAQSQIQEKNSQLDDYRTAHMANKLSLDSFIMFETKLLAEIKGLEDQIAGSYASPLLDTLVRAGTKKAMRELWDKKLTLDQKREVLRILPMTITIVPATRGRHTPIHERVKVDWVK